MQILFLNMFYSRNVVFQFMLCHSMETDEIKYVFAAKHKASKLHLYSKMSL